MENIDPSNLLILKIRICYNPTCTNHPCWSKLQGDSCRKISLLPTKRITLFLSSSHIARSKSPITFDRDMQQTSICLNYAKVDAFNIIDTRSSSHSFEDLLSTLVP